MAEDSTLKIRENPDGSWEAICEKCHITVASAYTEALLTKLLEKKHVCYNWNSESRIKVRSNI